MSEGKRGDSGGQATEHAFQAEVQKVLDIVIHSLYGRREVFLRELVSNAADALDKLRFRALTEPALIGEDADLEIRLRPDPEARTLAVLDNGIGMTREEMIAHLGTIAQSGSRSFLESVKAAGQDEAAVDLVGRFGVGFYSAFLVADEVTVTSRAAGADEAWTWRSRAAGTFTTEPATRERRGTEVLLHLKEDQEEFLDEARLRHLVKRYSDYVGHPIKLEWPKPVQGGKTELTVETLNEGGALWKRPKAEIEDEQYVEFYRHLGHDWEEPLAWTHFTIEGSRQFTGLLFLPRRAPFDLFDPEGRRGVRLHVKRVFIMDDCEELVPSWLRFLRGIVDSDDLPLNVSRETLQEDRAVRAIRKGVVKKTLDMLEGLAKDRPEDYRGFWESFGAVFKEGLHHEEDARPRLARLVRWPSSAEELTSLEDYVARMPEGQGAIWYASGPSLAAVEGSPHIEALRKRGQEVLFMTDPIDEWAVRALGEFEGRALVSAMRADLDLDESASDEERREREETDRRLAPLVQRIRETLDDQVAEVRVSRRLDESPACLVVPEGGAHAHVERLLRERDKNLPAQRRILEINPEHDYVRRLEALSGREKDAPELAEWIFLLHDQALLAEGSPLPDPGGFARRVARLMSRALPE